MERVTGFKTCIELQKYIDSEDLNNIEITGYGWNSKDKHFFEMKRKA